MRVLVIFLALLVLSGCASHDRGNLSDAMESSASGGAGRGYAGGRDDDSDSSNIGSDVVNGIFSGIINSIMQSDDSEAESTSYKASETADYEDREFTLQIPFDVSYLVPLNGAMEGITRFTLTPLAAEDERNFLGLYVGGGGVEFKPGSLPDSAVEDAWILEIGLSYRRYLNDPHVFLSPYLTANLGWQPLFWQYRNPIDTGDETINGDVLHGVTGYAGFGVALWRRQFISAFAEAGFGGTGYVDRTGEGFHNDVFDAFGYFLVKGGVTLKF
jgi:hypothetical protein